MSFLSALADQISSQFSLGENTNHDLDSVDPDTGKKIKYGSLGDFAKHFDQSAERRYVEEGYLRKDPYNTDPKQFEVLFQEPNATVLIKKKMFSSVGDNFRPDFMDEDEQLYYKSMRVLFQNKCAQIAALEKLSKIQKITSAMGSVPDQLVPLIISATDALNNGLDNGSNLFGALGGSNNPLSNNAGDFSKTVDRLRRIYAFNTTSPVTAWITDSTNLFQSQFGQGTGVIEITNFTSLNTNVTTELSGGSFGLNIVDPYESMLITEYDIEKAISDATNMFYNSKLFQFGKENSNKLIGDLTARLNQIRASRGAGPLTIKLDPDTLLGRRVTIIFDRLGIDLPFTYDTSSAAALFSGGAFGSSVSFPPSYLRGGESVGQEGIDSQRTTYKYIDSSRTHHGPDSELSLLNRLISTIYSKISLDANSQNAFQTLNQKTNYTRRKLRFNFSGKLIIQPMDVIHIYINSKSRYDVKLLSGLQNMFTGLGMLQNLNNTLTGLKNAVDTVFRPSASVPFQVEKSAFVGPDFPNYLWSLVRGNFVTENEGTHVFAGIVDNAIDNWSDGKFTIDVRGRDNTAYFEQGKINFKPGVDVYNGAIFDPLTPFKSEFDTITSNAKSDTPVLLEENQSLLGTGDDAVDEKGNKTPRKLLIKNKLGRYAGQFLSGDNIIQDRSIDPVTGRITKVFYAPDGLVYKWKEGIGVFTQFGSNLDMNGPNSVGNPNIAKEPFAGQDVMNVLSLLITGQPYNFATYFKATQQFDSFGKDPQNKQDAASSYALSLRNDLIKSNTLWGNFIPFKNLVIDEASYTQALSTQTTIVQKDQALDAQIKKLKDLNQQAMLLGAVNILSDKSKYEAPGFLDLKSQITEIQKQVEKTKADVKSEINTYYQKTGNDISTDATDYIDPKKIKGGSALSDAALRRLLRRQLNYLTRRMSYNVRGNEDKNLFIVDDFYDKDIDIMAYEQSLTDGIKLYNNEFTSVKEKIGMTAELLNLEVFCDTQGHIRCRPPQYNRMPSSVFYRMMYLKQALNVQIFPQFLDDLFNTKLDTIRTRLEILEDQIRLDCAILGHKDSMDTDIDASIFIISSNPNGGSFSFISDPESGLCTEIQDLMTAANPDQQNQATSQALDNFNDIKGQASTKNTFSNAQKYSLLLKSLNQQKISDNGLPIITVPSFQNNPVVDELVSRIQTKSGQRIDKNDYLVTNAAGDVDVAAPTIIQVDVFKVVEEISDKIRERQKVIKLFYNTIKNAQEFKALDDKGDQTANHMITPGVFGKSDIPEVFEHMIEDETYDDYGPGSGTRFIIKRAQIRNISISENPPPWTTVEVHGVLNPFAPNALPEGLNAFPGGGNGLVTALAVDYDMWRNYGFKEPAVRNVPFLSDPVSQCGPYASMLLSRNRKNVLRGSVTISGNEFMQPGEVVFIEDRQLLFYVNSVKHSFTYASGFTTTLDLTYGHTAGEYIPTVMDMIGKMIYNNKDAADLVVQRQDTSANEISVGVVQLAPNTKSYDFGKSINADKSANDPPNSFSAANAQVINNILYTAAYQINASSAKGSTVTASVELRVYHDDSSDVDDTISNFASYVRQILVGKNTPGLNSVTVTKQGLHAQPLPDSGVKSIADSTVNLDNKTDRRSPSQSAMAAARNQLKIRGMSDGGAAALTNAISNVGAALTGSTADPKVPKIDTDKLRTALFKYIVDCWITITTNQTTT